MDYTIPNITKRTKSLIRDYILLHFAGLRTDAIEVSRAMSNGWGLSIDWHPISDILDSMTRENLASYDGTSYDRMTAYYIHK